MRLGSLRLAPHQTSNWPGTFPSGKESYCAALLCTRPGRRTWGSSCRSPPRYSPCPPQQQPPHGTADDDAVGLWSTQTGDPDPDQDPDPDPLLLLLRIPPLSLCLCRRHQSQHPVHLFSRLCPGVSHLHPHPHPHRHLQHRPRGTFLLFLASRALGTITVRMPCPRFLPSRGSYHTLPSLDHTPASCLLALRLPGPAIDSCQAALTPSIPAHRGWVALFVSPPPHDSSSPGAKQQHWPKVASMSVTAYL